MIYASVDIETTGLNPDTCVMIEFAAILADSKFDTASNLPLFHCYIDNGFCISGEPYALSMHSAIFKAIATKETSIPVFSSDDFGDEFVEFLLANGVTGKIPAAGKNFGSFDLQFLKNYRYGDYVGVDTLFSHRNLDPTMLYFDPVLDDKLPDLATCFKRAVGWSKLTAHNAVDDAQDVLVCLNAHFAKLRG